MARLVTPAHLCSRCRSSFEDADDTLALCDDCALEQARGWPAAHDPVYCDTYRPRGSHCNQPHAASDPFGARRPTAVPA